LSKFIVKKTQPLKGRVKISGAKNSVLPVIAASLLSSQKSVIENAPYLEDVNTMCKLLKSIGVKIGISKDKNEINILPGDNIDTSASYDLVNKMRASFLITGPLLARFGNVRILLPGGCAIGLRPIDLHLKGFSALGANIRQGHGYIVAECAKRLTGNRIYLDFPSVGATENILMAATLAKNITYIENAATEPEIVDLAAYLTKMGAKIKGAGTDSIRITGVDSLNGTVHTIIPDRIEAGTFMIATAITGGDIIVEDVIPNHLKPVSAKLREAGIEISEELSSININARKKIKAVDIKTHPYPGFPTDMQAQMTALMSTANGTSVIVETIFENRFLYVNELKRMGALIKIEGHAAVVQGIKKLSGAHLGATDLRAGAALVIAALNAEGTTEIEGIEHIDRGYMEFDKKLKLVGADIQRIL
jgi:UDP-N-acetylglucosamine 1-carboxyvinyltransferase